MKHQVAIIILNWNGKADTLECLGSVYQLNYPNFEVIVVDNGSTDGSSEAIREAFPEVTLIENGANLGYAGGNNVGIQYAYENGADYFWLLNNDTTVDPLCLKELVKCSSINNNLGILSPMIFYYDEPTRIQFAGGQILWDTGRCRLLNDPERFMNLNIEDQFISGCAMLIKRKLIESIGYLDELFLAYYEDTDYSIKCIDKGFELTVVSKAKIYHKGSKSVGGFDSKTYFYLLTQSRFKFMHKYKDRFGSFFGFHSKFIANCIRNSHSLFLNGSKDASNSVWESMFNCYGKLLSAKNRRETVKTFIFKHPYFWADIIELNLPSLMSSIKVKIRNRLSKINNW